MIFKKLFKSQPKWQHDDMQVRLTALQELDAAKQQDREIIEKLAFEDASEKVRLTGLSQLNDFELWNKALQKDKSSLVKKKAEEQVRNGLLGKADFSVDETIRQHYIDNCNKSSLLEELAVKDKDEKIRLKLLQRLNKPSLLLQSMQDGSDWLKQQLIENIDELPVLEKLRKKASNVGGNSGAASILDDKINAIKAALEKPKALQKDVNLMLAKLNALKDKHDIVDMEQRREQLNGQWQAFKQDFNLFSEEQVIEFTKKYDKISHSLDNLMAPLKQKWQEQQAKQAEEQEKSANKSAVEDKIKAIAAQLTEALINHSDDNEQTFKEELTAVRQHIDEVNLAAGDKTHFIAEIEKLYGKVAQIPQIAECVNTAMTLVKQLDALALPEDTEQLAQVYGDYQAIKKQWQENERKLDMTMPDSIATGYRQLVEKWQQTIEPMQKEQQQNFNDAKKGLSDLRYLVGGGKYRRAFGLFKKVTFLYESLNESQQSRLSRDYESTKAKIEDLADWQEYIATPRKQQLLEQMQELAENPVQSPQEQAQKVKFTRQMFNSLGRANDDSDKEVNEQFNIACEKAFEVCRVYYAEQEAIRKRNYEEKLLVCEQLEQSAKLLEEDPVPWQKIESALATARKAFKEAGDVDREKITEVNDKFYGLFNPIQKQLKDYHGENATLKEQLIDKAKALLEMEDVFAATNELKNLQKRWKDIGFAGNKADSAIWKKFRQINDQVFAARDEVKNERTQAEQAKVTELTEQLEPLADSIKSAKAVSDLNPLSEQLNTVRQSIKELGKASQGKLNAAIKPLEKAINDTKNQLVAAKQKARYEALFSQFALVSSGSELDSEIVLEGQWAQLLKGIPEVADQDKRIDLTIQLEIVAGVESPKADAERRKNIQMELLSAKMNGGALQEKDALLKDWIALGRLESQDDPLFDRVKALYL